MAFGSFARPVFVDRKVGGGEQANLQPKRTVGKLSGLLAYAKDFN